MAIERVKGQAEHLGERLRLQGDELPCGEVLLESSMDEGVLVVEVARLVDKPQAKDGGESFLTWEQPGELGARESVSRPWACEKQVVGQH